MKLSKINTENLTDEQIDKIVYSNIFDNGNNAEIAVVFGHYLIQKYRINKAVELYKNKRIKKILLLGGKGGISNQSNETKSEAEIMKELAVSLGIKDSDIFTEDNSNNTIENCINAIPILNKMSDNKPIEKLILVSSEFHLKRCLAIFTKYFGENVEYILVPAKDGFTDKENWFQSDGSWNTGRSIVIYEAKALVKNAIEKKINDLEIIDI